MVYWIAIWKVFFVVTVAAFGLMSVWVSFQGARDIKALLATLKGRHEDEKPGAA
ncbi:MAG: hypothetical protein GY851_25295 [bacterium]|nr:hypothetical protein [bacterium]